MRRALAFALAAAFAVPLALATASCAPTLPCAPAPFCKKPGAPCRHIASGTDACSGAPRRYTCECAGRIIQVPPTATQNACDPVLTWCEGRVARYHAVASFQDAPPDRELPR